MESKFVVGEGGLTKREYFAGLAMQGILSGLLSADNNKIIPRSIVEVSVKCAEDLVAELEKNEKA